MIERFTEYHAGVAVIKDKNKMKDAMKRFAELEDRMTAKEVMLQSTATYRFKKTGLCPTCGKEVRGHMKHGDYSGRNWGGKMDEKKVREAIETIKNFPEWNIEDYWLNAEEMEELIEILIEALEKQLPKKVEIEAWCPSYCPSCGYELSEHLGDGYYKHPNFIKRCPNPDCAQLLDWSE